MSALRLHRFLLRIALAGASVFAWVFAFQYFYLASPDAAHALARTALLYALSQTVTCLVTPYAARLLRHGSRRAMTFALLSAATGFVFLGAAFDGFFGVSIALGIIVFAVALGLYRALYWIPYEVEVEGAAHGRRMYVPYELIVGLAPACVGLAIVSSASAPTWVLFAAAGLIIVAALPLSRAREVHERFSWKYRETFVQLMARENRTFISKALLEGMSGTALLLLWPIAVFLIVGWSYGMLGIVLSFTFIIAILGRSVMRGFLRRARVHESRLINALLAVSPWLLRLVVATPLSIVLVDSYFYTTAPARQGIDPYAFEQASDGGSFVDEYTALKEMALALGRITTCVLAAGLALLVSLPVAFIGAFALAALASVAVVSKY
jgi:hypothetical protein